MARKADLTKQVEKMAGDVAEQVASDALAAAGITQQDDVWDTQPHQVISSDGFHSFIYKVLEDGKWELKDFEIDASDSFSESILQSEALKAIKERGWGAGTYWIREHPKKGKGFRRNIRLIVGEPTGEEKIQDLKRQGYSDTAIGPALAAEKIIDNSFRIAERMTPKNEGNSANAVLEGVKLGKELATVTNPPDSKIDPVALVREVMSARDAGRKELLEELKALGVVGGTKPVVDEQAIRQRTLEELKALGLLGRKDDAIDSVDKVTNIISKITPLINPEAAPTGPPSWGQVIMDVVKNIDLGGLIGTIKDLAEVGKINAHAKLQALTNQQNITQSPQPSPEALPALKENSSPTPLPTTHPFVTRTIQAISKGDETYFKSLRRTLYLTSPAIVEGIIQGEVDKDGITEILGDVYGFPSTVPNLKEYLEKFVKSVKESAPNKKTEETVIDAEGEDTVFAKCDTCGVEYGFKTMEEWDSLGDSDKSCDEKDCKGKLELVKE